MQTTPLTHIGFIMDGNRRWAKKLGNIAKIGHENGGKKFEEVIMWCHDAHIPFVSFWALSKENITERSEDELEGIFDVFRSIFGKLLSLAHEKKIRLTAVGDLWLLPLDIRTSLLDAMDATEKYQDTTVILAIAYSGQDEIIRGVKRYILEGHDIRDLDEKKFLPFLDTGNFPPPDLIVRTGGAERHSGYFLYRSAYSEYFFSQLLWPDFSHAEFEKCIEYYSQTKRNFGK